MWDLPNPEIKPASPALAGGVFTMEPPGKPISFIETKLPCKVPSRVLGT